MTLSTQSADPFEKIDLRDAINAIRQKYAGRPHTDLAAQWEVAALWGITPEMDSISDHGGFTNIDERIPFAEGGCQAEIRLVCVSEGLWQWDTVVGHGLMASDICHLYGLALRIQAMRTLGWRVSMRCSISSGM